MLMGLMRVSQQRIPNVRQHGPIIALTTMKALGFDSENVVLRAPPIPNYPSRTPNVCIPI